MTTGLVDHRREAYDNDLPGGSAALSFRGALVGLAELLNLDSGVDVTGQPRGNACGSPRDASVGAGGHRPGNREQVTDPWVPGWSCVVLVGRDGRAVCLSSSDDQESTEESNEQHRDAEGDRGGWEGGDENDAAGRAEDLDGLGVEPFLAVLGICGEIGDEVVEQDAE